MTHVDAHAEVEFVESKVSPPSLDICTCAFPERANGRPASS
jgi:hypothetical protein